jgi:hypothetical protein
MAFYNLHFVPKIRKVLVGTLFLLGNESIALDTNDKSCCKPEGDAKESSFCGLVEPYLLEQVINA